MAPPLRDEAELKENPASTDHATFQSSLTHVKEKNTSDVSLRGKIKRLKRAVPQLGGIDRFLFKDDPLG